MKWQAFLATKKKTAYRIRNWREYNHALKQRGSLTAWVSKDAIANWTTNDLTGEPGASPIYTDLAIETMASVQAIYRLAGRQTQGFLQHGNRKTERHICDENLRRVRKVGRKQWKKESNYHRRSLAETTMFRFKTIFGDRLQSRRAENQSKELLLKTAILNRMTHLGMPDTIKIEG